mmetsp:Transcript_111441/g.322178  ORF Transcript_111441/g.322178 Transcript_111441/m.322178 type:complete len:958 (-) Transcript_111441:1198-4071(-)
MRQLQKGARVRRRGLHYHLRQFHREEGWGQPAARRNHINETLQQSHGVLEDEPLVGRQVSRDRHAAEVRVQQELRLGVRIVQLILVDLDAQRLGQASKRGLLAGAHWHGIELGGGAEDVDEASALRVLVDAAAKGLDGGVPDVVVRGDEAQVRRRQLHIVLDAAAAESLESLDCVLDDLRQVVAEVLVCHPLEAVVIRILRQAPVIECPSQPIHRILLVLDRLHDDLCIHVVGHPLVQMTLHRQRLIDELLVVLLLRVLCQEDAHAGLIYARAAGATHHLEHVVDGVVDIAVLAAVELLRVHDNDEVRQHRHAPSELLRGDEHLDGPGLEEALDHGALRCGEALVQEAHAVLQRLLQRPLPRRREVGLHGLLGDMQEAPRLVIRGRMQQEVCSRHPRLLPVRDENDHRLVWRVVLDGLVHGPAHCQQPRGPVVDVEPLDDHLERDAPHVRREVEKTRAAGSDPVPHVPSVGQGGRQGHDSDGLLHLGRDVAHAADDGLESGPHVAVQKMKLVDDKETNLLNGLARLPSAAHQVPLLRRGDHQVRVLQGLHIDGGLADELRHLKAQHLPELVLPLIETLLRCGLVRRDVDTTLDGVVAAQHPQHRKFGADDLPGGRRRANEGVVAGGVERAEGLRLDGVEDLEALSGKELLRIGESQGCERQGLQVEQLRVRRVSLGQNEVPKRDRQQRLRINPPVGHDPDEILRRQRLCDRHCEVQSVLLLGSTLLQHEHLLMQDLLAIHILNKDPERLCPPVHSRVPLEVWGDGQLHHEARSGDRLHVCAEIQLRELMHKLVDRLAHLLELDQLGDLGTRQIVVALPSEVLLLDLPKNVLGQALEMPERRLRSPHALVDHLAPVQRAQRQRRPTSAQADLEDRAHNSAGGLLDVHHIRQQRKAIELQFRDVRLKKDVDLRGGLVCASLHGDGNALHELGHLHLLLFAHRDVLELVRQREQAQELDV